MPQPRPMPPHARRRPPYVRFRPVRHWLPLRRALPVIIAIRHADVDASAAADPDVGPPLSDAGSARAEELRHVLGDTGLEAIFVTKWQRTQLTARPLAADLGIDPTQIDAASEVVAAIRAQPSSSTVLVVGHTNTVPEIISGLGGPSGLVIEPTQFDRMYVFSRRLTQLRYGA
jgi:broad specificity phosphatase PhoE